MKERDKKMQKDTKKPKKIRTDIFQRTWTGEMEI